MNLQKFTNREFGEIRTLEKDNQIWFVGRDIANILGYTKQMQCIESLMNQINK